MRSNQIVGRNECILRGHSGGEQPAALNYDIKIIILFPFLFIIRIIILCRVIIGEMFRSDKRSARSDTQAPIGVHFYFVLFTSLSHGSRLLLDSFIRVRQQKRNLWLLSLPPFTAAALIVISWNVTELSASVKRADES